MAELRAALPHGKLEDVATRGEARLQNRLQRSASIALFFLAVVVYMGNGYVMGSGDTLPARYLPFSLLRHFNFYLDDFPFLYDQEAMRRFPHEEGKPYYLKLRNGHYVSTYPPGPALLALPVYALPVLAGMQATSKWVPHLEKLSATLITAFSVLFLFWALRELISVRWAPIIAMIYAFGTSSLSISSQALWQHGPSQFFLALALYFLVRGMREERFLAYAGFTLASSIVMRPTDALIALPIAAYVVHRHRHSVLKFVLFSVPPLAFLLSYNYFLFSSILGGYAKFGEKSAAWRTPLFEGFFGVLLSPSRGLFVYSPILILSIVGVLIAWTRGNSFLKYLSLGPPLVVFLYSKHTVWWGGHCYGPRVLADLAPILCFFLYPVCQEIEGKRLLAGAFLALGLLSVGFHALGVYWNDNGWNTYPNIDHNQYRLWTWYDSPIVYCGRSVYYQLGEVYHRLKDTVFHPNSGKGVSTLTSPSDRRQCCQSPTRSVANAVMQTVPDARASFARACAILGPGPGAGGKLCRQSNAHSPGQSKFERRGQIATRKS